MDSHVGEYRALGDVESSSKRWAAAVSDMSWKAEEAQRFKQILKSTTKKFQRKDSQEAELFTLFYFLFLLFLLIFINSI